jgi:hypothetical protein
MTRVLGLLGVLEIPLDVLELMPIAVISPITVTTAEAMIARRRQAARRGSSEDGAGPSPDPVATLVAGMPSGAPHRTQN